MAGMQRQPASLLSLPAELLTAIFLHVTSADAYSLSNTCRSLRDINDQDVIWRHYCLTEFDYWAEDPATEVISDDLSWRTVFWGRAASDEENAIRFEAVIASPRDRYRIMQTIATKSFEASDMLARQAASPITDECNLARRFWAHAVLQRIKREAAIRIWHKAADPGAELDLEEQFSAFDMFVLRGPDVRVENIKRALDQLAEKVLADAPNFPRMGLEDQVAFLIDYLRTKKKIGMSGRRGFHDMANNFLSTSLLRDEHGALPLQSATIFCGVATRLGIKATPCNFPGHIFVCVRRTDDFSSATKPEDDQSGPGASLEALEADYLYYDPFTNNEVIPFEFMVHRLRTFSYPPARYIEALSPGDPAVLVRRAGENIQQSIRSYFHQQQGHTTTHPLGHFVPRAAMYAYNWCVALVDTPAVRAVFGNDDEPEHNAPVTTAVCVLEHFPEDLELVRKYLPTRQRPAYYERVEAANDARTPKLRNEASRNVAYRIGQVFKHKRYAYHAVIHSWDVRCQAQEHWMLQQRVDELGRGRSQAFYHILADDGTGRYVAEDNIQIVTYEPPEPLMDMAGRYFKRYDKALGQFVSNIAEEYPDD